MKLNGNENQTEMFFNCNVILCKYMHQIINKFPVPGSFSFIIYQKWWQKRTKAKICTQATCICSFVLITFIWLRTELLLRGEPQTCHLFLLYITKKKSKWWLHLNMTASVQVGNNKDITGILKIPAHSLRQHDKN